MLRFFLLHHDLAAVHYNQPLVVLAHALTGQVVDMVHGQWLVANGFYARGLVVAKRTFQLAGTARV